MKQCIPPNRMGFLYPFFFGALLVVSGLSMTGCLVAASANVASCIAEGGDGYRVHDSGVKLARCDTDWFQGLQSCDVAGADPKTFRSVGVAEGAWWGFDSTTVYRNCVPTSVPTEGFALPKRVSAGGETTRFRIGGRYVFWIDHYLRGADAGSFEIQSPRVGLDRDAVWVRDRSFTVSDPGSVRILADVDSMPVLVADHDHVFEDGLRVEELDPADFTALGELSEEAFYFHDGEQMYWGVEALAGSDAATFQVLTDGWSKDKNQVYLKDKIISGADPATFRVVNATRGSDASGIVTYSGQRVAADPATYKYWKGPFWRDATDVWADGRPLGLGPQKRLRELAYGFWEIGGRVVKCQSQQCCVADEEIQPSDVDQDDLPYIVTQNAVYLGLQRIEGIDPASFERIFVEFGRDRQGLIWAGQRVPGGDAASFSGRATILRDKHGRYEIKVDRQERRLMCPWDEDRPCVTVAKRPWCAP